ncbi:histidine phosphatase family protein [Frigidibacter mobilis]|uniref:Phosphoglycerate mutase n=1 Tax=Frigidibacter mobilis TaxID=1335048 RepID=A0A159Z344_9RHOB|nr:histidine phosphatase family protein [Frigidibacter mobilis]AMY69455.1 phosphoglycerate mutase [Frigidibacter mobilis]
MPVLRYLSHPEVAIDPEVPVPDWGLRARGHARMRVIASLGWPTGTTRIVASAERKARETAAYLAEPLGLTVEIAEDLGEIDRSSTGYVPPTGTRRWPMRSLPIPRPALRAGSGRWMRRPAPPPRCAGC